MFNKALIQELRDRVEFQAIEYSTRLVDMRQAYQARIDDLHKQVQYLQTLVYTPTSSTYIPAAQLEADGIISGREEQLEVSESELKALEEVERERDRILSGQY